MTVIPWPQGWFAWEEHLVRDHGVDRSSVEQQDSDGLRGIHRSLHAGHVFSGAPHRHE